jgi:threonine/homoserine/homoserine lactone efflux protein
MFGIRNYWLFIVSGLLLNITPGQDTFYIVGRSISQGRRAGILSVPGISSGCLVHTLAAAFGLSAILAASIHAFMLVKWIGAAYLVYPGLEMLVTGASTGKESASDQPVRGWIIYRQGMLTNVLNPKVALFFLAFLPQFVEAGSPSKVLAFLILGMTFVFNGTLWCLVLVWFASAFSRRLRERPSAGSWLKRAAGALFVGLGLKPAFEKIKLAF